MSFYAGGNDLHSALPFYSVKGYRWCVLVRVFLQQIFSASIYLIYRCT